MSTRLRLHIDTINPVLDRELRQRSRSIRSVVIMTIFLGALIGVSYIAYLASAGFSQFSSNPLDQLTQSAGRTVFEWVLFAQVAFLMLIIPALSAGAIAGERDRQTLIPLQVTLVGPVGIFLGKVIASAGFVLLMLVAAAPVLAVPFVIGGISLSHVIWSLVTLLALGFLLAAIGVSCSSIFRRTQTATLAAYAVVAGLVIGSLVGTIILMAIDNARGIDIVETRLWILYLNPFVAVADAAGDLSGPAVGPFGAIKEVFTRNQFDNQFVINEGNGVWIDGNTGRRVELDEPWLSVWVRSLGSITLLALFTSILGVRRLRAPYREIPG